jgi:hypothetical protein
MSEEGCRRDLESQLGKFVTGDISSRGGKTSVVFVLSIKVSPDMMSSFSVIAGKNNEFVNVSGRIVGHQTVLSLEVVKGCSQNKAIIAGVRFRDEAHQSMGDTLVYKSTTSTSRLVR